MASAGGAYLRPAADPERPSQPCRLPVVPAADPREHAHSRWLARRLIALLVALALAVGLVPRAPAGPGSVAVLLSSDADEYREALRGFKEAAGLQVVSVYNMDARPRPGAKAPGRQI